ncbi:MAG: NAD(P)/FAD-dependent oxidoreductase [Alphaproteobacteria bacterium]|nr:NAD(P)/FAD-dependent oxidoreductase [Alphaproteobacteria bacterium]
MERLDCAVIGAGVVGLAVARALARDGRDVVVLEAADAIGTETSSRNSEVIHAGIYYATGSLKARLCVAGKAMLYAYCAERGLGHARCGKLIVATSGDQTDELAALKRQADANGVHDLAALTPAEVARLEPEVRCVAALHSPSTGIVDSHGLMLALQGDAEERGAMLAFAAPVERGIADGGRVRLVVGGAAPMELDCALAVNCAGLHAPGLARRIGGIPAASIPPAHLARGCYFTLTGRSPFARLVYPMPEPGGLGVHITLDLAGQARFGPDVEWIDRIDYAVDSRRAERFYASIRRYWPGLPDGALQPGYSGIRPKISGPGEPARDFVIAGPEAHGVPGWIALYGIESPGLTSSLAIGAAVARIAAAA